MSGAVAILPSYSNRKFCEGVSFGGTPYYTRSLALTAQPQGLLSFWIYLASNPASLQIAFEFYFTAAVASYLWIRLTTSSVLQLLALKAGGNIFGISSDAGLSTGAWHHVLASWDVSVHWTSTANGAWYIDDAIQASSPGSSVGGETVNYATCDTFNLMAGHPSSSSLVVTTGEIAEFYFAPTFLDLTQVGNRRKFITADKKPVWLGTNGAGPTGSQPWYYYQAIPGDAYSAIASNKGSQGDLTLSGTGTPSVSTTSPSQF